MHPIDDKGPLHDDSRVPHTSQSPTTHTGACPTASSSADAGSPGDHPYEHFPHVQHRERRGPQGARGTSGNFYGAHDFVVNDSIFVDGTHGFGTFMKELGEHTIPGAEFDSSERDPPPQCHPGTRLKIVERTQDFFDKYRDGKRLLWIVGPAGVGKSAIMQTLAEIASTPESNVTLGASLFFSVNGRDNASKAITTLAYQIAVIHPPYRQFVHDEINNDPKLPTKSIQMQFRKFIVKPFANHGIYREPKPLLILIDGLDECADREKQSQLISLISNFSLAHPGVPLIWVIASRPEPHITTTFSQAGISSSFVKEEIVIDSDEARADVERYLRDELKKVREKYVALQTIAQWPREHDFLKLAATSDGLFVFASTAIKFIDDPGYGNPAARLDQLLDVIGGVPTVPGGGHPMAVLHALYNRILSQVPNDSLPETRKLLLHVVSDGSVDLVFTCNWLGMTPAVAYGALHHLHSVFDIPSPEAAWDGKELRAFHKSFGDYVRDFERSGMFEDFDSEAVELDIESLTRIFDERSDDFSAGVTLSWDYQPSQSSDDIQIKIRDHQNHIYAAAMSSFWHYELEKTASVRYLKLFDMNICHEYSGIRTWDPDDDIFSKRNRRKFLKRNILREIPIGMLDTNGVEEYGYSEVQFWYADLEVEDSPLDSASVEEPGIVGYIPYRSYPVDNSCVVWYDTDNNYSCGRPTLKFTRDILEQGQIRSPDHLVLAYLNIRNSGLIVYEYTDPRDDRAEWKFTIPYTLPSETGVESP
ncbi:hypothetical protein P691DRAFT_809759 [Macrolepiota fuliginosa MF-IS2]|uniref:NACHT domain-containing protein n=1 Tax=Macrolepiota fuliginosa MF-IS2 TaxID=1400762 RepID=A0A9P5X1R8_9AGAR|nr:hypothetical protein P691DRAFT_809759 [Macrolepiota fuliginosa MF-IS2]